MTLYGCWTVTAAASAKQQTAGSGYIPLRIWIMSNYNKNPSVSETSRTKREVFAEENHINVYKTEKMLNYLLILLYSIYRN